MVAVDVLKLVALNTLNAELRIRSTCTIDADGMVRIWFFAGWACCTCPMVIVNDVRMQAVLALTRDAVLSASARLARGAICVRALARLAGDAARSVWPDNVVTLLTLHSKLRVCSAIAIHTCGAICVRLLTW